MPNSKLKWIYCECGCHCHTAISKGIMYSIYSHLIMKNGSAVGIGDHDLHFGHARLSPKLGTYKKFKSAVNAAQKHYDKIP
jgi:hypothetical protein